MKCPCCGIDVEYSAAKIKGSVSDTSLRTALLQTEGWSRREALGKLQTTLMEYEPNVYRLERVCLDLFRFLMHDPFGSDNLAVDSDQLARSASVTCETLDQLAERLMKYAESVERLRQINALNQDLIRASDQSMRNDSGTYKMPSEQTTNYRASAEYVHQLRRVLHELIEYVKTKTPGPSRDNVAVEPPYQIASEEDDEFLTAVNNLIATMVAEKEPNDLGITYMKKWFDHKWLGYSGNDRVKPNGECSHIDTHLEKRRKEKHTFPLFDLEQIAAQKYLRRRDDGTYGGVSPDQVKWMVKTSPQRSADKLNSRVVKFPDSGLFFWFTSTLETNVYKSVMVYQIDRGEISAWYASFQKESQCVVELTKGIDKKAVESWFPVR